MTFGQPTAGDLEMMNLALGEARSGLAAGGVPVGAVLATGGRLLAAGRNERVQHGNPVAHAEIACLRNAGRRASYHGMTMYTTLSPCAMCSGAILLYGIPHVIIGENRTFLGEEELLRSRGVRVEVVQDPRCIEMMREFVRARPDLWLEDIGAE